MFVSSDESIPEAYFLNLHSTVDPWGETFFSYIEFLTLNHFEGSWLLATGMGWAADADATVLVTDDFLLQ